MTAETVLCKCGVKYVDTVSGRHNHIITEDHRPTRKE